MILLLPGLGFKAKTVALAIGEEKMPTLFLQRVGISKFYHPNLPFKAANFA